MMALQAIVMSDQRYREYLGSVDFIRTHVFPGGCLPCNSELMNSVSRATDMRLLQLEDFAPHYARTLRDWRSNFDENRATIERLGFDAKFQRLWEYYLCYCEAAFEERHVNLVQMLLAKKQCRFDPLSIPAAATGCESPDKSVQSQRLETTHLDVNPRSVTVVSSAASIIHQPQGTEL
jgi:cyclopropane-fatty-acyl-phospholipid synthase